MFGFVEFATWICVQIDRLCVSHVLHLKCYGLKGCLRQRIGFVKTCRNVESTVFFLVPLKQVLLAITSVAIVQCVPSS